MGKTKYEKGLCNRWGCKSKGVLAIHPSDLVYMKTSPATPWAYFTAPVPCIPSLICSLHWEQPGPYDIPSLAEMYRTGYAKFTIEVIESMDNPDFKYVVDIREINYQDLDNPKLRTAKHNTKDGVKAALRAHRTDNYFAATVTDHLSGTIDTYLKKGGKWYRQKHLTRDL